MIRIFLIILVVGLAVWLIASYIQKGINNFLKKFINTPNGEKNKKEEVLYQKDDVVVLKGDAENKES